MFIKICVTIFIEVFYNSLILTLVSKRSEGENNNIVFDQNQYIIK